MATSVVNVSNLNAAITDAVLANLFNAFGPVIECRKSPDGTNAVVKFGNPAHAQQSLSLNGQELAGTTMKVEFGAAVAGADVTAAAVAKANEIQAQMRPLRGQDDMRKLVSDVLAMPQGDGHVLLKLHMSRLNPAQQRQLIEIHHQMLIKQRMDSMMSSKRRRSSSSSSRSSIRGRGRRHQNRRRPSHRDHRDRYRGGDRDRSRRRRSRSRSPDRRRARRRRRSRSRSGSGSRRRRRRRSRSDSAPPERERRNERDEQEVKGRGPPPRRSSQSRSRSRSQNRSRSPGIDTGGTSDAQ